MTEQQGPDGAGRDDSDAGLSDTETQVQQEANELLEKAESKWEKVSVPTCDVMASGTV